MLEGLIETGVRIVQLVIVSLPLVTRTAVGWLADRLGPAEYFAAPGLARISFVSGAIAGALLLYVNHQPGWYEFDTVFAASGPWAVPFLDLFVVWMNPALYPPGPLMDRVIPFRPDDPVAVLAAASAALALLVVALSVRFFRKGAPGAVFASALVWAWAAALSIYLVCAAAWALNMLNFWAVVIAFVVYRHYHLKAH